MIKIRKISGESPGPGQMETLRSLALSLGADEAVVLPVSEILLDPRVRYKCMVPKCYMSGACSHCPPLGWSLDEIREILSRHDQAVFFQVRVPSRVIAAKGIAAWINSGDLDSTGRVLSLGAHYLLVFSIVKLLQKKTRDMGFASAMGFAAGNCKDALCHFQPLCGEIQGTGCRHLDLSSPSMESCGMDVFSMAARQGWVVFPIGGTCVPESVGHGTLMGLVPVGPGAGEDETGEEETALPSAGLLERARAARASAPARLKSARMSLAAIHQAGFTPRIFLAMSPEARVWARFNRNLRLLTGSWAGAVAKTASMFSGRPRKE